MIMALLMLAGCQTIGTRGFDEQVIVRGTREHPTLILSHRKGEPWTRWEGSE